MYMFNNVNLHLRYIKFMLVSNNSMYMKLKRSHVFVLTLSDFSLFLYSYAFQFRMIETYLYIYNVRIVNLMSKIFNTVCMKL